MKRDKPNRKNITERTNEIKGYPITDVTEPHRTSGGMKVPMADKAYIARSQTFGAWNTLRTSFSFFRGTLEVKYRTKIYYYNTHIFKQSQLLC
jgi:hypothetical protein